MSQAIEFDYDNQHYTLEYSRNVVRQMEASGFSINEVDTRPATRIPQLWQGAFMMHHKRTPKETINEIYTHFTKKDQLIEKLVELYFEAMTSLIEDAEENDPKKIEW